MSSTPAAESTRLELRRTYPVARERLFDAWTTPDAIKQFYGPKDVVISDASVDLRVGGAYRIAMTHPDGDVWIVKGIYRELDPPSKIECTWVWEEDDPKLEHESLLTLEFLDRGEESELVLTHDRFRDATQRDNHESGWSTILAQLDGFMRPFRIAGIDLSGYMVNDAQRAIGFYRDVLGLEPSRVYPENRGAEYELPDGTVFGLWGGGGKVMPFQPSNGILFAVGDFAGAVATLKARGIPIVREIETPNCRMAMIEDTEGNLITLHERKAGAV